jgi:hypothetical protein
MVLQQGVSVFRLNETPVDCAGTQAMWESMSGLVAEIKRCEDAGATTGALALAFVCIDTMAFLSVPAGKGTQSRDDFIAWVDAYLKGDPGQPYQYKGLDVYGARCAFLHSYRAESDFHQKNPNATIFAYHDGGKHMLDENEAGRLVLIGTASFLNDVICALESFLQACLADPGLRERVETRLPKVLRTLPARSG